MGASIKRDLRSSDERDPGPGAAEALDPEGEAEVQAVAVWFEALPAEWKTHLDYEARQGRAAYART